jgi:integrase
MGRRGAGQLDVVVLADRSRAFRLRYRVNGKRERETLHERRDCRCGCGGGWNAQTARAELEMLIAMAAVDPEAYAARRRRRQLAAIAEPVVSQGAPTFHAYASWWLRAKIDGVIGRRPIDANTEADYRWRLSVHLLPFFGGYRLDEIDRKLCERFKEAKLREAEELRVAIAGGADLRDGRGRRLQPLGLASIKKLLETLAAILDEAIEDEHIDRNPARSRRLRVQAPKPPRSFLEMDELAAFLDAAAAQDASAAERVPAVMPASGTAARVAEAAAAGLRPREIALELGIAKATVSYHLRRFGGRPAQAYVGRRAVCETLGRSGVRVSELCDLLVGEVRLHDPEGARFRIPDAKTEAGIREVQMSPDLVKVFVAHFERLRRGGKPRGPEAYAFPNVRGGRISRQRVARIVGEAAALASVRVSERGLPPLPRTTPHTLRRTYISIALLANNFDVLWVMGQVGHADSKMTTDVYAQLQQRVRREHGKAFDLLVRQARERLYGPDADVDEPGEMPPIGPRIGPRTRKKPLEDVVDDWREEAETP